MKTLRQRVITALWGVPVLFAIVWFGEPWYTLLLAAGALLGVLEFYRLIDPSKGQPLTYFGLVWTLLFVLIPHAHFLNIDPLQFTLLLLASAVVFPLIWLVLRHRRRDAIGGWAWTIFGVLYMGWLFSYFVALRGLEDGRGWVLLALCTIFATDSGAFFAGSRLGRHSLAPKISPGKTWEGAVAGFLSAIAASLILRAILCLPLNYWHIALLGCLIGVVAQLGDLVESSLKRGVGVKDSGNLIPGHGGVLDRVDSVVFVGVVVYYYVIWATG